MNAAAAITADGLRNQLGIEVRTFQKRWAKVLGYSYRASKQCEAIEIQAMREAYAKRVTKVSMVVGNQFDSPQVNVPAASMPDKEIHERSLTSSKPQVKVPAAMNKGKDYQRIALLSAFILPTLASVSNTLIVSHALSGNIITSIAITGVASASSLLFLFAGAKGISSWVVVALTLGFEAFCNSASVFKALMGTMSYSISTVSGEPSEFLQMVSVFTNSDHQDTATIIAVFTAVMICFAQTSAIFELKKTKK
jgi:hypothetical protein